VKVLSADRDRAAGYKVDVSRGQRVGRVSSEWFSRPADERYLFLSDLYAAVRGRTERSRTWTVQSAAIRVCRTPSNQGLIGSRCMLRMACAPRDTGGAGLLRCVRRNKHSGRRHGGLSCRQAEWFRGRSRWTLAPISTYSGAMRARSRSTLARPYMARLRVFSLLICPSVCPLLHGSNTALRTASMSWRIVRANRCIP
jgi:hypothetical protein